jgi:hypothetical protein
MNRSRAIAPRALLQAPIWDKIRESRERRPERARETLHAAYAGAGLLAAQGRP